MENKFGSFADKLSLKRRRQGRNRKIRFATADMLHKEIDIAVICDILNVTPEFVENIRKELEVNTDK